MQHTARNIVVGFRFAEAPEPLQRLPEHDPASAGWVWCHLDRDTIARDRLLEGRGIPDDVLDVLVAEYTRPLTRTVAGGLLFVGRGLPEGDNANPDDTLSIRAWIEPQRIITVSLRPVPAVAELARVTEAGDPPTDPIDAMLRIVDGMTERIARTTEHIGDQIDRLNQDVIDEHVAVTTGQIAPMRIQAIVLARYVNPLRTALSDLQNTRVPWVTKQNRRDAAALVDRVTRTLEDLVSAQSRAAVARDEIVSQQSESLNRRLYGISVLTAVFLPLAFLTGALGMNLTGIPFSDHPWSFPVALFGSLAIVALEMWILRRVGWL